MTRRLVLDAETLRERAAAPEQCFVCGRVRGLNWTTGCGEERLIVAVTGHRPHKLGYGPSAVQDRVRAAIEGFFEDVGVHTCDACGETRVGRLSDVCPCGQMACGTVTYTQEAISGMALGVDQWFAETCIVLGIPFTAAVPCDDQERLWPEESQRHYRELLAKAHHVRVVSPGPYAAWKMQARNEYMVNECDVLLAVWDGSSGGTANCVRYAEKVGKPVWRIDPKRLEAT